MIVALGIGLFGMVLLSAAPPDIAGEWSGEEWGRVVLKKTGDGEYAGTYSDRPGQQPGEIQLKWSRPARRFNGTWRAAEGRFGELSVRLAGDEIRGARTTDPKSQVNADAPGLVDFLWVRGRGADDSQAGAKTGPETDLTLRKSLQPRPASPAKEPGSDAGRTEGEQTLVAREIERLVQGVRVDVQEKGAAKQVALLKGPLLRHDDRSAGVRYALGTMWAWGDGGRPAAILDLSLTGYADNPAWCFEMVSLSTRPVSAESRSNRWWATEGPGWNPRALPKAPQPAQKADERLVQMKALASRFAGYRVQWNGADLTPLTLRPEPILRYGNPLDGALFVFVIGDNNPEILLVLEAERQPDGRRPVAPTLPNSSALVLEAERQPQGGSAWKYHCAPFTANGLVLKLDGQEAWTWSQIGDLQTKTSDPYRIYLTPAKDELEE